MRIDFTFRPDEYAIVHLADDEWGNDTMSNVARDFFSGNPSCLYVQVFEHGGWMLGFRRDLSIWNTANDMARLDGGPAPCRPAYVVRRAPNHLGQTVRYPLGNSRPRLSLTA